MVCLFVIGVHGDIK